MKLLGGCWVTYLYNNPKHIHLLAHEGTNSDRIFFDFCMIPKPTIKHNDTNTKWHSYINHIIENFPDGKIHWDGGLGAEGRIRLDYTKLTVNGTIYPYPQYMFYRPSTSGFTLFL